MKSNTISVFIGVDHFTDFNIFLESLHQIINQNNSGFNVDIVVLTTAQIPEEVHNMYNDFSSLKARFENWPDWLNYFCFKSDDHSYNKVLNYIENEANGEVGELCTFKSIAPIEWFPNHLVAHWNEYKSNKKKCGWLISRIEVKDIKLKDDEKRNTIIFRIEDFPDHIDKIVLDEIFISYKVLIGCDLNTAAVLTEIDGNKVAIFHAGKFLVDSVKKVSDKLKLECYNPKEITVKQWIDIQGIKEQNQIKEDLLEQTSDDGSIVFADQEDDGAIIFSEEK